ncbi:MAG: PAS domain-containing protein [Anaerolineae bacterium]|nr:PAS domain-containing protein [Anaerolineae bacterium]
MFGRLLPYIAPLVIAAIGSLGLAMAVWRRREVPGSEWFAVSMLAVALWSVAAILTYVSSDLTSKIAWTNVQYVGITTAPLAWLLFVLHYTGRANLLSTRNVALLTVHPALTQLVIWTNPYHNLFRERVWLEPVGAVTVLGNEMGPLFWLHAVYSYGLMLVAAYVLVRSHLYAPRVYRRQGIALLVALLMPWVANAITLLGPVPLSYIDLTPFAFTLSGLALTLGLLRYDFLDLVPVAREAVMESMAAGVIVLDRHDRIADLNPAAEGILEMRRNEAIGQHLPTVLPQYSYIISRYRNVDQLHDELSVGEGAAIRTFDLRVSPLRDRRQQVVGHLVGIQDITRRKRAEIGLSRYADRLRILYEIDQAILAAQSAETIALAALNQIHRLLPCKRMSVVTFDRRNLPRLLAIRGNGELSPKSAPWATAISREDFATFEPKCVNVVPRESGLISAGPQPTELDQILYREGVRAYLIVPLVAQDQLVGTLNLEDTVANVFTAEHLDMAAQIATSLAVALENARLYAAAQQELAERKLVEEALRESETSLRQKADDLVKRNAELDAFAHTVAHDLKTPLSLLLGYTSFLNAVGATKKPEDLEMSVRAIGQSARKMSNIIDELLLLASVRKMDEVHVAPVDMEAITYDVQVRLSDMIDEYGATIIAPKIWPIAWGYAPWIEEVWANYISNAIKYGGTPPRVELGATIIPAEDNPEEAPNMIRFWVRDNGKGLTEEQRARLFIPFERLEQARAKGYGLGLSIVQRIMHKLGGVAGVEERPMGQGSVFYFELPEADL